MCTEDKVGGEITIAPRGVGTTLDTYTAQLGSIQTGYEGLPIYSTLVRYDVDSREYVPHAAEALTANDDATVWTLKLRDDVTFGNGDPLNADALVAHLDRHLSEESTSAPKRSAGGSIAEYTKVDDWTVELTLAAPNGNFPAIFAGNLGMVQNVAVIEEIGEQAFQQNPQGGGVGPYEASEWTPPARIVLTAKKDWWGGPICIEKITLTFIPDLSAAYDAYNTGEVDMVYFNRDPATLARARSEHEASQFTIDVFNGAFVVMPNIGLTGYEGAFRDVRVRQAMAYAIDPDVINDRAWGGEGWPGKGLINEASAQLPPTEGLPYDPERARELLDEYKAETGWDGTIGAIAASTPPSNREAGIVVAAQLEAVGFKVEANFDMQVIPLITAVSTDQNFELVASWGFIQPERDLYNGLRSWMSPTLGGYQNGYTSEAYDAALAKVREAVTVEEYEAALAEVQAVINEEVPFQVYGADVGTTLTRENIHGIVWHRGIDPLFEQVYLSD